MSMEKIRVIGLGAGGGMGRYAVKAAAYYDFVDEIVIVDRDHARAREVAENWVGDKAVIAQVDITDAAALNDLLSDADVVLNTVGPFYRFGLPLLEAAIDAGCHYLDICDDWEPTLEMLDMDEEAKNAGITAIIGIGASPGVSNMLAVKAMQQLDTTDYLLTGWGESDIDIEDLEGIGAAPGSGGSFRAAYQHLMRQISGSIRVLKDGEFVDARPLEEIEVTYPGIGRRSTYTVGHPEPVTLPRHHPEIKTSYNVMFLPGEELVKTLAWLRDRIDSGKFSIEDATDLIKEVIEITLPDPNAKNPRRQGQIRGLKWMIRKVMKGQMGLGEAYGILSASEEKGAPFPGQLFAYAEGMKDDKPARAATSSSSSPAGGMGGFTGIPLAIGLAMLGKGLINRKGVFAPEDVIDPDAFFDELAPLCSPPLADGSELVAIALAIP